MLDHNEGGGEENLVVPHNPLSKNFNNSVCSVSSCDVAYKNALWLSKNAIMKT